MPSAPQPPFAAPIESTFTGDNSGQIAVGNNIVQWTVHGDFIESAEVPVRPRLRDLPVRSLPKPVRTFLDREQETERAVRAMESATTVEICGPPGQGKTAMLRFFAHGASGDFCRDGVIFLDDRDDPVEDILQFIFDAFHEYDIPVKPTEAEMRLALGERYALVLIDEARLDGEQLERLINALPNATVVLAAHEPCAPGEVESVTLGGLPMAETILLIQGALGRALAPDELDDARRLWEATGGNPGRILAEAKRARQEGGAFAFAVDAPAGSIDAGIPDAHRRVVETLAAFGRTPVASVHAASIAGVDDADQVLASLEERGLVEERDGAWLLASGVALAAVAEPRFAELRTRAIAHFADVVRRASEAGDAAVNGAPGGAHALLSMRRDLPAARRALGWGISSNRFAEILPLIAWTDGALLLEGRWGARERLLEQTLAASRSAGDRTAEAWALHQSGSRAQELGETERAESLLREALTIRDEIGDEEGAMVTRNNLGLILIPKTGLDNRAVRIAFITIGTALLLLVALVLLTRGHIEPPTSLVAARTPEDSTKVQLAWSDHADNEEGFLIERSSGGGFTVVGTAPAGQTFHIDRGVRADIAHVYRVRAFAGDDRSRPSNTDTVSGMRVLAPIDIPAGMPRLVLDTSAIDFGLVDAGARATRTLVVRNEGTAGTTLVLTPPETPFRLADSITSMSLEPGVAIEVGLVYEPADTEPHNGVLVVDTPDDTVAPVAIRLIGSALGSTREARLASFLFDRSMIESGSRARLEVRFSAPVEEDAIVELTSGSRDLVVPSTLIVPRGSDRASIVVVMPQVRSQREVRVTAEHDVTSRTATALVVPRGERVALAELQLSERSVIGGSTARGGVRLSAPAPRGGAVVSLGSSSRAASVPDRVLVPEGSTTATFPVTTNAVRARQDVTITASLGTARRSATLVVMPRSAEPPQPTSRLSIRPEANVIDVGRGGTKSSARVGLSRGWRNGITVMLESSEPQLVVVPRSVTIPPGATAADFSFTVRAPREATTVVITARIEQPSPSTATAAVTVQPAQVILR